MSNQHIQIGGNAQGNAFGDSAKVLNKDSFNQGLTDATLQQLFATLTTQLAPLRDEMKGKDIKVLDGHLEVLTAEAAKPEAQRDETRIKVSAQGLKEAAETVKGIAGPVLATVGMILKFFGVLP